MMSTSEASARSGGRGCLKAGGIGCLVVLILLGVGAFFAFRFVRGQYDTVMARFEREGYKRVEGQVLDITEPVRDPTIFVGQVVRIRKGSERGIALLCQTAEIDGKILGNVHFVGQVLTVNRSAHLLRDLDLKAQVANVYGTIDGKITGVYATLNRKPPEIDASPGPETAP